MDKVTFSDDFLENLNGFSDNPVKAYSSDSDCVLLSWRTPITKEVIEKCPDLKFICLCATNSNLIDLETCSKSNIAFSNIKDYGDEGVVEWIFLQLLSLVKGFGEYQWKNQVSELSGKTLGIIGLGTIGKMIADVAWGFGMNIIYYSRTRNVEYEERGALYANKKELLQKSDFISLQTPKNIRILDGEDFDLMHEKVLINNTLGKAFNDEDFLGWIKKPNNYLIIDMATDFKDDFRNLDRVILSDFVSGLTSESAHRLSKKALDNIITFLNSK